MKGFAFTTDALFALVIAGAAISVILYFHYFAQTPYLIRYTESQNIMSLLLTTTVGSLKNSNYLASQIAQQGRAIQDIWMQYQRDSARSGGNAFGPLSPSVDFIFTANAPISSSIYSAYGDIYFIAGNFIYALDASSGVTVWVDYKPASPRGPILYNNLLLYSNSTRVTALRADNGNTVWTAIIPSSSSANTMKLQYDGKIVFASTSPTDTVFNYFANNGILGVSSIALSFAPANIAVINGSLIASDINNNLRLFNLQNDVYLQYPIAPPASTTGISTYGNIAAYGSSTNACAVYINGSTDFCPNTFGKVTGVSNHKGLFVYQNVTSLITYTASGTKLWSKIVPQFFGSGFSYPVVSDNLVYSIWSNGFLAASNLSTGKIVWYTRVPYGTPGNMSLAYSRLYLKMGNRVIAFGSCNADPSTSLLSAVTELYVSGQGSCADALLNTAYTPWNYSIFINSSFYPETHVARFNGLNSYIEASNTSSLSNYSSGVTYEVWFNLNKLGVNQGIMQQSANPFINISFSGSSNKLQCSVANFLSGGGGSAYPIGSVNALILNTWYQAVLTYNTTTQTLTCYLNGVVQGSPTFAPVKLSPNYNNLTIGNYSGSFFNGSIANVQVYNKSLSSSQVAASYHSGMQSGPMTPGIVAWYPLDGDTNDYSGFNNTAYSINTVYAYGNYIPSGYTNAFEVSPSSSVIQANTYVPSFNSVTSYILSSRGYTLNAFTVSVWYYSYGSPFAPVGVVQEAIGSIPNQRLAIAEDPNSDIIIFPGACCTQVTLGSLVNPPISPNKWYSFILTAYNAGPNINWTFYLNGARFGAGVDPGVNIQPVNNVTIGGGEFQFGGRLSDVQIYNSTLSASQALALYSGGISGAPIFGSGLLYWWPLNGNAKDYSGNGNNGVEYNISYISIPQLYNVGVYSWR